MHKQYLLAALEQADKGRGFCAPNPSVGAVIVLNDKIIARDFHKGVGTPHAEALVIEQIPADLAGATLYVTLEPCNHWGRTPPCVDAIIRHGIKNVVFAYRDPNPVVASNDSVALLAKHNINAIYMPLPEINAFYESYHYWRTYKRPFVTAKLAQTIDSKIANPDSSPCKITNEKCHDFTHQHRLKTDIILTSAQTIHTDNPRLNARLGTETFAKDLAILDRKGRLTLSEQAINCAKKCYIYYDGSKKIDKHNKKVTYKMVNTQNGELILPEVISHLGHLGYHDVWVEAGAKVFTALHQHNLVNRTYIYIAPKLLGENAVDAFSVNCFQRQPSTIKWLEMDDNMILRLDWG